MKHTKSILKIVIPLFLGVILVWYSLTQISISNLLDYFRGAEYLWIFIGLFFGICSHLSRAYRWLFMAEALGFSPKLSNSFMSVYAAYLINFTIPRAGEIARASILSNYENIPFDKGFGTIVAERVADTIMLLVIIGLALVLEFEFIYDFFSSKIDPQHLITLTAAGIVVVLGVFFFLKKSTTKVAIKIRGFFKGLFEGVTSIFKMEKKWPFIFHTIFIWVMYLSMFYITAMAIPQLNDVPMAAILIGFILASFSIAATNGGIGSFPEAIVIAFLLFNLPEDPSRAFGWLMWTTQTLVIIIIGGVSLLYLPIYNRKK